VRVLIEYLAEGARRLRAYLANAQEQGEDGAV
jgi:hypothetical protein